MYRRFFSSSLLLVLTLVVAIGQNTNAPDVARLRKHIEYLASDQLEGRRTGTPTAQLAAEYIAHEFSRYGLRRSIGYDTAGMSILEANSPNRYLQKFPYVAGVELGKNNELKINKVSGNSPETQGSFKTQSSNTLNVGEDWMPLGFSSNGTIEKAGGVFVGYGITDKELKYDDYTPLVKGKIAVALSGTPDGDNPHGKFFRAGEVRWKALAARNAGASALIIISKEDNLPSDPLARLRYDNSGEAGLLVAVMSRQSAAAHFAEHDLTKVVALEKMLSEVINQNLKKEANAYGLGALAEFDPLPNTNDTISLSIDLTRREVPAANVVGILDGSDPVLKKEVIVIGAHYDHLGHGGEGSLAPKEGEIHHGADDNASGTAGMLELARIFAAQYPRPRRTLVFIAFSGEEEGLLGSNYYVNHPILPLADTVAMINMDMIGRMKDNKLIVGGVGTAEGWRREIDEVNFVTEGDPNEVTPPPNASASPQVPPEKRISRQVNLNMPLPPGYKSNAVLLDRILFQLTLSEDGYGPSDHSSFYAKQIPVLFFWTGTHEDYHKPSDTADKINYEDEARILTLVARVITDVAGNDKRPTYLVAKSDSNSGRSTGFRVYLGTIPNYADSSDGLLLDGVRDESPAAKAGIKAGDKIVKLAGRDVHNVYDYTYALGEMKAGQEYEVELMRAGERIKLKITPAARK